ncbi:MAG TPA: DUF3108 domain-containing protein [Pyrinomonadaceae bacterium]|nr:DUF3108 domain-containing protein [Pyrinomonadaceae bacterium]
MNLSNLKFINLKKIFVSASADRRLHFSLVLFSVLGTTLFFNFQNIIAQNQPIAQTLPPTPFRIGERLTYSVSFEKFNNAAYAEIYAVSRGKLGERDAVELRSKIKTNELVSAFYLVDESRTTYASSESGLPLYIRKTSNASATPKETINNYTVNLTAYNDLLTMIYQARNSGGIGAFSFQEDDKIYNVIFQTIGKSEKVKNEAGEFDTNVSTVQSEYLTEKGITNLRVNFSSDTARIPVLIRFKTAKGDFRADLASVQAIEPEAAAQQPTPVPVQTPRPAATPKPVVTPTPYIENEPLATELPFKLGETLEYQISNNGQMFGFLTLQAKERKQFSGQDSLLLTATVTGTQPNQQIFKLNDSIRAQVNPLSLAPQDIQLKLSGALAAFSQQVLFDQRTGKAMTNKGGQIEIPVGTHSILSLAYAVRSFNLKPSKDLTNPVNDTRVAVFLDSQAYVFTLRPSNADIINLQGERVSAQLISVTTGNRNIDQYNLRLWLSTDDKRLPLRLMFGSYQADLVSEKSVLPK